MIKFFIEFIFSIGLFINSLLYVPQIIRLYKIKHANDISLTTFAGFNLISIFIFLHAYIKNDTLLMIGYALTLATNTTVTLLIIWYRYCTKK
ncbi:MAG TPA: PQ-loop domain-containing transporter [Aquella sp.]|nr:PQ-loop domain-containing transporter [Aquella sp.]